MTLAKARDIPVIPTWKRWVRKLRWKLLILKNPRRASYPKYTGKDYAGPHVALNVLRNAKKVNEHYRATEKSGCGITGTNIQSRIE